MADDSLTVQLSADDEGLSAALSDMETRLEQLEAAFKSGDASAVAFSGSVDKTTASSAHASEAATGLSEALDKLGTHYRATGQAAELMGVGMDGFVAKAGAAIDVLASMGSMVPEFALLSAAIIAVGSAFNFIKDGIEAASAMQSAMAELKIAVEANGQAWGDSEEKVKSWAEAIAIATGTSTQASVGALLQLVDAGQSLDGAMSEVSIATQMVAAGMGRMRGSTDLASSSAQRFQQIIMTLNEAQEGNYSELERLDPQIKKLVDDHASLSQIMAAINAQTKDAITENNTNAAAWNRLHGSLEVAGEELGEKLLPALTYLAQTLVGGIRVVGDFGTAIGTGFHGSAMIFVDSIMAMVHGVEAIGDAIAIAIAQAAGGHLSADQLASPVMQMHEALNSLKATGSDIRDAFAGWEAPLGKALVDLTHMHQIGTQVVADAEKQIQQAASATSTILNPPGKATKSGSIPEIASVEDIAQTKEATDALKAQIQAVDDLYDSYKQNAQTLSNFRAEQEMLSAALARETDELGQAKAAEAAASSAVDEATAKYNALAKAINASGTETKEQAAQLKIDKEAVDQANSAYNDARQHVDELGSAVERHTKDLQAADKGVDSFTTAWEQFVEKTNASVEDSLKTYGAGEQQKVAATRAALQEILQDDNTTLQQREDAYRNYTDAVKQMLNDEVQAYQKAVDEEQKAMESLFDDILTKGKSGFQDAWKSMWQDLAKQASDALVKGITGPGSPFQSALSQLFPQLRAPNIAGQENSLLGGSPQTQQLTQAVTSFGTSTTSFGSATSTFSSSLQQSGSSFTQSASTMQQAAQSLQQAAQTMAQSASRSGSGGFVGGDQISPWYDLVGAPGDIATSTMNVNVAGLSSDLSQYDESAGVSYTLPGSTGGALPGAASGTSSSIFGGALMGMLLGAGEGGNPSAPESGIWGSALGGLGDTLGTLFGGPVIGQAAGALGSIIGSMFGPQYNATDNPDMFDPNNYDQFVADVTGATGTFNGQTVNPETADWTAAGGTSLATQMADWLQQNKSSESSLTPAEQAIYNQLQALGGGSDSLGIASEHQGEFTLTSGQQVSVSQYQQLVDEWQTLTGGSNNPALQAFTLTRTYPDFNTSTYSANGESSPTTQTLTPVTTGAAASAAANAASAAVTVQAGIVVGPNGIPELVRIISQEMRRQGIGLGPASLANL